MRLTLFQSKWHLKSTLRHNTMCFFPFNLRPMECFIRLQETSIFSRLEVSPVSAFPLGTFSKSLSREERAREADVVCGRMCLCQSVVGLAGDGDPWPDTAPARSPALGSHCRTPCLSSHEGRIWEGLLITLGLALSDLSAQCLLAASYPPWFPGSGWPGT